MRSSPPGSVLQDRRAPFPPIGVPIKSARPVYPPGGFCVLDQSKANYSRSWRALACSGIAQHCFDVGWLIEVAPTAALHGAANSAFGLSALNNIISLPQRGQVTISLALADVNSGFPNKAILNTPSFGALFGYQLAESDLHSVPSVSRPRRDEDDKGASLPKTRLY